jgi:hypothetical protein
MLAIIPGGALERAINAGSLTAPLRLPVISILYYLSPEQGMVLCCELLANGTPFGTVFCVFLLGIGVNLATFAWIAATYGFRPMFVSLPIVFVATALIGWSAQFNLPPSTVQTASTPHLLEIESGSGIKIARTRAIRSTVTNDRNEPQWSISPKAEQKVSRVAAMSQQAAINPQRAIAGVVLAAIILGAAAFIYYPAPREVFKQMDSIQTEMSLAMKEDPLPRRSVERLISRWSRLQHKLIISGMLRTGRVSSDIRAASDELRKCLSVLRGAVRAGTGAEELTPLYQLAREATVNCRNKLESASDAGL